MSHASTATMDFPALCEAYPVGATVRVDGSLGRDNEHTEVVGIDRNGYVIVAAPKYDQPGCVRVTCSFAPSRVQVVNR